MNEINGYNTYINATMYCDLQNNMLKRCFPVLNIKRLNQVSCLKIILLWFIYFYFYFFQRKNMNKTPSKEQCLETVHHLCRCAMARNALPSRQLAEKSLMWTPGNPSTVRRLHSSSASRAVRCSGWPGTTTSDICQHTRTLIQGKLYNMCITHAR